MIAALVISLAFGAMCFRVGALWQARARRALHEPRALRLLERKELRDAGAPWLLDEPSLCSCRAYGDDIDHCAKCDDSGYERPAPTSMPGDPERRSG